MQCLWLIPCLKVNAYFMNADFPAGPNNHLRITGLALQRCYKSDASFVLYAQK